MLTKLAFNIEYISSYIGKVSISFNYSPTSDIRVCIEPVSREDSMFVQKVTHYKNPPANHPFRFKPEKAAEAILYLINRLPGTKRSRFFINKLFFYADLRHLEEYSRYIAGDFYEALKDGPIPSGAYNLLKEIAGENVHTFDIDYGKSFRCSTKGVFFDPLREADLDMLSRSDIECLDYALAEFGHLSKHELWNVSHDEPAYKSIVEESGLNNTIEVAHFARFLNGGEDLTNLLAGER
jgi:uncharacterized phage-associated protein